MSCILTISGQNLDVDAFINKSKLRPYKKSYKGQPKFKSKPNGDKLSFSLLSIETSKADFDNLKKQIVDTIRYLKRNQGKLAHITSTKEIEYAVLNFGIDLRIDNMKILIQSEKFPNELLKLADDVGLDIELSIYPTDLQETLEKKIKNPRQKSA